MLMDPTASHQRCLLTAALRTSGPILELGAGWYSTPLLHAVATAHGRPLVTLDTDAAWLAKFRPKDSTDCQRHKLLPVGNWAELKNLARIFRRWGLVLVDQAPPLSRGPSVDILRSWADVFVLHDTESPAAYGYETVTPFRHQITDKAMWTWTTVASDSTDVTGWGLGSFQEEEEKSPSVAQYLLRIFPDVGNRRWYVEAGAHTHGRATLDLHAAGWDGLCIEPSTCFFDLAGNRTCLVDQSLLGERDAQPVVFYQYHGEDVELSGIEGMFLSPDGHQDRRDRAICDASTKITVRLSTVLSKLNMPTSIEALVLDTEGSELAILRGHDFGAHRFKAIVVDYNGVASRRRDLTELLWSRGYVQSRGRGWDDGKNLTFVDNGVAG